MKECQRCGECCQWLAAKSVGMSPETMDYLVKRGLTVDDGYVLIPHKCQHLKLDMAKSVFKVDLENDSRILETPKYYCDIHYKDEYPVLCKRFHGHGRYYIPHGCVYFDEEDEQKELELCATATEKSVKNVKK